MTTQRQRSPDDLGREISGHRVGADASTYFRYIGRTGLTVVGGVSGKRYRFDQAGAIVAVDPSDRPSLASVPKLIQVARP